MKRTFYYYVNLDERGEFHADLRDENGETVYEVVSFEGEGIWQVNEGFMRHKGDFDGLKEMLIDQGYIPANSNIMKGA